nr:MAG TPA: hypothetical protein [Caudoviricetes sp.]
MTRIDGFLITHRIKIPRTHKKVCIGKIRKIKIKIRALICTDTKISGSIEM